MAVDNTQPRLKLIATIGVITIITLVGVDFALRGYYGYMTEQARRLKLAPTTGLDTQHAAEKAAFAAAGIPLDQAMADLAKGSRGSAITPQQSDDLGPMTGWSKLPKPAPTPIQAAPHAATEAATDAGSEHAATDAGAATHAAPAHDAGAAVAPKPAPKPATPKDAGAP